MFYSIDSAFTTGNADFFNNFILKSTGLQHLNLSSNNIILLDCNINTNIITSFIKSLPSLIELNILDISCNRTALS